MNRTHSKTPSGGHIFVISAPSGTGKTSVIRRLLEGAPGLSLAVSCTTRRPRHGEKDGVDYTFMEKDEFGRMAKRREFMEWAEVHGHLYGTPAADVDRRLSGGDDVLLDVDVQGAKKVKEKFPGAVTMFLLPPSFDELEKRLKGRGTDSSDDIERRIKDAREEYSRRHEYDYQIINENLDEAVEEIREIVEYHRSGATAL